MDFGRYPIDLVAEEVIDALRTHGTCVVVAPPGTGKTTRLPLLLPASQRIIVTEPRRAAALAAAQRMAATLGERVGQQVGLRMRDDTRVSAETRIEVVTEGVFVRMLRADPFLSDISTILFDEVHERSLDSDVALALSRYARELIRPDLQLIAMSATLDADAVARLLNAPVVQTAMSLYPVDVAYEPTVLAELAVGTARVVEELLRTADGDVLAFLPGSGEIRATSRQLARRSLPDDVVITALTGSSTSEEMALAFQPLVTGRRKVVLATAVAQTSLTIPGVRSIVDSGLTRRSTFDQRTGISRLITERSSKATAIQRAGRAGREAPGRVVRLWSKAEFDQSTSSDVPEIQDCDLCEVVMTLASWGLTRPEALSWIDAPPSQHWLEAVETVRSLGLVDRSGMVTELGESVRTLPAHPRVQVMLSFVRRHGDRSSRQRAADLAAELAGSPSLRRSFVSFLNHDVPAAGQGRTLSAGLLGALAFPDRVAARITSDPGRYQLVSGVCASLDPSDPLRGNPFLVALDLDADRRTGRIFRAEPLTREEVSSVLQGSERHRTGRLSEQGNVEVYEEVRYGALVLEQAKVVPTPTEIARATVEAFDLERELSNDDVQALVARLELARSVEPTRAWPDWSLSALRSEEKQRELFLPHFESLPARRPLDRIHLVALLLESLPYETARELDALAPKRVSLPSGRQLVVEYRSDAMPTIRSRLQDFFGLMDGPTIGRGRIPLRIELLSPAGRPAAITSDLRSFWAGGYKAVRTDLRHRYPKHAWPDDPTTASPRVHGISEHR